MSPARHRLTRQPGEVALVVAPVASAVQPQDCGAASDFGLFDFRGPEGCTPFSKSHTFDTDSGRPGATTRSRARRIAGRRNAVATPNRIP